MSPQVFSADAVFDGTHLHPGKALIVHDDTVAEQVAGPAEHIALGAGYLVPGYVDLQVNGGGGVLLNDAPTVEGIETICAAHARLGTAHLLATLITDGPDVTTRAVEAALSASGRITGFAGLHLEGPHLSLARKGAHDGALVRPMTEADLTLYTKAAELLPTLKLTVAPEMVTPEQISQLTRAGALVSLGHSDATFAQCTAAIEAGARCVTHLFNAMSQMQGRAPGLVGAALQEGRVAAGLIADGHHVSVAAMQIALRAKQGPGPVFLVSDAMAVAGTQQTGFALNGRDITRRDGRLTLDDGTLAGADLSLSQALRVIHRQVGVPLDAAFAMATSQPAGVIGQDSRIGHLRPGAQADFVWLAPDLTLQGVWRAGRRLV